ncbi:MAG: ArsR family transcriptional regulator [Candidatus Omnitrophica bacterium]|nr:ArsR family transcriptional regulator [Candidatus Omnitrophota bacterium]MCM8825591.1 ArsR family transcriptional regulator [Candidatus Omnitrophota bacterium]
MEKAKDMLIEAAVNLGESLGLNRAVCQIYALLYLSNAPLSPTEIGKSLEMSKGNVSINLRILEQWNAVRKVWKKGYSRPLYTANEDIEMIIFDKLKTGIEKRLSYVKPIIMQVKNHKDRNLAASNEKFFARLDRIERLIGKIEFFLQNLDTIKAFTK